MTVREEPDGTLLALYDNTLWSKLAAAATVMLLGTAVYDYFIGARGDERVIGLLGAATTMGLTAVVMLEQSIFRFDPVLRLIVWEQRWAFRRRTGNVPFDDVRHVSLERPLGDDGVPSRRVVLHLADATVLPVTRGYQADGDERITRAAGQIRRVLGREVPTVDDTVRLLLEQGRTIEAVKVLEDREGLSITEAKLRIDRMRRG